MSMTLGAAQSSRLTLNRLALLSFYDDLRSPSLRGTHSTSLRASPGSHVSAITGLMGEDLVLGLLLEYLRSPQPSGNPSPKVQVVSYTCSIDNSRQKLDAWITTDHQGAEWAVPVEVKNWSTHSLGEAKGALGPNASVQDVIREANKRWERFEKVQFKDSGVTKVTKPARPPSECSAQRVSTPILAFWLPIAPATDTAALAPLNRAEIDDKECLVFSASLYLRALKAETVSIEMPRMRDRLAALGSLLPGLNLSEP